MTKEEAKCILSELMKSLNEYCGLNDAGFKAFNMAIKALEQESCEDAISRAEAQTAIQCAAKRYCTTSNTPRGIGVVTTEYLISITDATDALRKLPPVNPKPKTGKQIRKKTNNGGY